MAERQMERKTFPALVTKFDEAQGLIETVFAVFGNIDEGDDVIHPGAFAKTFTERGHKVKVLDNHRTDSIMRIIGKPLQLREVGRQELPAEILARAPEATGGAFAQIKLLMDTPEGRGAFVRLRDGAADEWSFGYDAVDYDYSKATREGKDVTVRNLRTLKLYEVSPVLWAMNPATATTAAKDAKPAPDVTENTIRIRVREPGDFQEGNFRTITIGEESQGIQAVIGRLEGETSTTVQSYIFDKDKWTVERAQAWVEEHGKSGGEMMDDELLYNDEGKAVWDTAYINDLPDSSFLYIEPGNDKDEDGKTVPRSVRHFPYKDADGKVDRPHLRNAIARIPQSNAPGLTAAKKEQLQEQARRLLDEAQGKAGDIGTEQKEGRVLSTANANRIKAAVSALMEALQSAGIDIEEQGKARPSPQEPPTPPGAGPEDEAIPTDELLKLIEIEQEQLKMLEV